MLKGTWQTDPCHSFNAWLPAVIFLQTEGPSFRKGFPTTMASNLMACVMMCVVWRFHKRQLACEAASREQGEEHTYSNAEIEDEKTKEVSGAAAVEVAGK